MGREVVRDAPLTTDELVVVLAAFRAAIPWAVARCQYDLLGSHDTARVCARSSATTASVRAALGLLLGYVGVPGLLYGDEVGLEGANGEDGRRTMPWDEADWDLEQLAFVRALVRLRTRSRALQSGGFQVLEAGEDSLAFLRDTDDEQAIVVVARGPAARAAGALDVARGAVRRRDGLRRGDQRGAGDGRGRPPRAAGDGRGRGDLDDGMSATRLAGLRVRDARDERPPRGAAPGPRRGRVARARPRARRIRARATRSSCASPSAPTSTPTT